MDSEFNWEEVRWCACAFTKEPLASKPGLLLRLAQVTRSNGLYSFTYADLICVQGSIRMWTKLPAKPRLFLSTKR